MLPDNVTMSSNGNKSLLQTSQCTLIQRVLPVMEGTVNHKQHQGDNL